MGDDDLRADVRNVNGKLSDIEGKLDYLIELVASVVNDQLRSHSGLAVVQHELESIADMARANRRRLRAVEQRLGNDGAS